MLVIVFDVFTEHPNIFFTLAAVVDTGVPWRGGQLVVGGDIPLHADLGQGTGLRWREGPAPPVGFGEGGGVQQSSLVLVAESRNLFIRD